MIDKQILVKKIEKLPSYLLEEVANYIDYIEFKKSKRKPIEGRSYNISQ